MTNRILFYGIALLFAGMTLIAAPAEQKPSGMICTLTNEKVESCCCERRDNGKLYCTKAKKEVDNCCCKAAEK